MADEIKELLSEILETRNDLSINGGNGEVIRLELDTIIEMKKLIELKEIQKHLFETACNIKRSSRAMDMMKTYLKDGLTGSIDDIHSMLYKMKEKM